MKKIFYSLCFVMFFFALFSTSFAIPDVFAFNNYYLGASAFSQYEGRQYYCPVPSDTSKPLYKYVVNSFSSDKMSGSEPQTSVNSLDMDFTKGKKVVVPSGNCIVVYSGSGSNRTLYLQGSCKYSILGTTNGVNIANNYSEISPSRSTANNVINSFTSNNKPTYLKKFK